MVEYIDGNHDFAVDYISRNIPMVKAYKPQGTYLMWLDMTGLAEKLNTKQMAETQNRSRAEGTAALTPETDDRTLAREVREGSPECWEQLRQG